MKIKKIATGAGLTALLLAVGLTGMNMITTASAASTDATASTVIQTSTQNQMHNQLKDVQRKVENLDNGVKITVTSTDAATVTKLQSMKHPAQPKDADQNITVTHINISNGVEVTITSGDTATITKIQEDAKNGHEMGFGHGGRGFGEEEMFDKNVTRNVENIDNGVKVTMTSTDAATVTKLQSMKHPAQPKDADQNITVTHTNISNGVEVTITSDDAATVTKIQEDAKNGHGPGFGHEEKGMGGAMMFDKNIDRKVENIDKGIKMTMTSTDAATVTKIQSMNQPEPKDTNITVNKTNLSNGVEITMTSDDAATVTKIQERSLQGGRHGHGSKMGMHNDSEQ